MRLKLALFLNYFLFAILLNSVGTVIFQIQRNFGVYPSSASILEACKDLSIATTSFLAATWLLRIGYKRAMLGSLLAIGLVCVAMPLVPSFWAVKLLFVATGIAFGLMKVSVFATLGLVASEPRAHASLMSFLESCFMVGVLVGYFLFGAYVDDNAPASTAWFHVYYLLAAVAFAAAALLWTVRIDDAQLRTADPTASHGLRAMFQLALSPLVLVFAVSVFIYVLTEQAIMSWLPTFNHTVLHLPPTLSVQMAAILAGSTALGRFAAGWLLRRCAWPWVLGSCLVGASALVLLALPLAGNITTPATNWSTAPLAAFVFPLIGLFLAPIYPTLNSLVLSSLPPARHGAMAGLIVLASALGGTCGSLVTGRVFQNYGGQTAFYLSLVPLALLGACLLAIGALRRRSPIAAV